MEVVSNGRNYLPGDPMLVDHIVYELKSQGIFDKFRKECIADVDTKPAYQNLRQRVEGSVNGFLKTQRWTPEMNKNQVREMLRKNISESGFLETGVERIVDQVVNPKINSVFLPQVEEVVYKCLGIKCEEEEEEETKGEVASENLLAGETKTEAAAEPEVEPKVEMKDVDVDESKIEEDESPPFEPLEENSLCAPPDDSIDSHMSCISNVDSNNSHDIASKVMAMDISQDSQTSKQSSTDCHLTIAIAEEEGKTEETKTKSDQNGKHFDFGNDREKKSSSSSSLSSKYRSSSHDKRDRRDKEKERSRHSKDHSRERAKSERSRSESSGKTRDRKHDTSKDEGHRKEASASGKSKDKEEVRMSSSSSSSRVPKHSTTSSRSSRKDEKSREREKRHESSGDKYKREKEKHGEGKKKKENKDDHYSYKDKSSNHRSTDGDSSDGHSGTPNPPSSFADSTSTQSKLPADNSNPTTTCTGESSSSGGNSDQIAIGTTASQVKLIKPKFASNIFEARRLMKIRRKLKKIEMRHDLIMDDDQEQLLLLKDAELKTVPKESWDAIEAKLNRTDQTDYNAYEDAEVEHNAENSDELRFFKSDDSANTTRKYLDFSCNYERTVQADIAKFTELNKELYEGVAETAPLNVEFTLCCKRGLKRKITPQIHNNNHVKDEIVKASRKYSKVFRSKKSSSIENSVLVPVQCVFNLPLSPAESDKSNDLIEVKKSIVRASVQKTQRYNSDDLYKPRLNFSSSRRRIYKE